MFQCYSPKVVWSKGNGVTTNCYVRLRSTNKDFQYVSEKRFCTTGEVIQKPKSFLNNAHLNYKWMVSNVDLIKQEIKNRNVTADIDRVVELYKEHCTILTEISEKNSQRTKLSDKMKNLFSFAKGKKESMFTPEVSGEVIKIKQEAKMHKENVANLEKRSSELEVELQAAALAIPNISHPAVPIGDESKAKVVKTFEGRNIHPDLLPKPSSFLSSIFTGLPSWFKDNSVLIAENSLADFEQAAIITGQKFCFLKKELAMLELALQMWAVHQLLQYTPKIGNGFTLHSTPDLVDLNIALSCGFQPRGVSSQIYRIANTEMCLIGTSEIPLTAIYYNQIIDQSQLPIRLLGYSHCFRQETGGLGLKNKGLYRLHQFSKVEMVFITKEEHSDECLLELLEIQESLLQKLGIPYQVLEMPTEELGAPATRKFDIEGWMPSRGYGELTSASNCTDYQSRRLNIRYKDESKNVYVHTLNATAVAIPRLIIAIIECFQQPDGTVKIPEPLLPYMNGVTHITPVPRPTSN